MAVVGLSLKTMCTPAMVYLVLSMLTIFFMYVQNVNNTDIYCLGDYSCTTSSVYLIFLIKIIYVIFWTWILNIICSAGATNVAWFLVLLPYILLFVLLFLFMLS